MNRTKIHILILCTFITTALQANNWQVGAGVYYADIAGVNAYQASENTNTQDTTNLTVPSFFISKSINDKFSIVYRYFSYNEIISNGFSNDANVFNNPNLIAPQVFTYYRINEKMSENSFAFNYAFINSDKWRIEAGPSISVTRSKADFFVNRNSPSTQISNNDELRLLQKFSDTDYTLGAEVNAVISLSNKVNLNFNYRYSNPSEKKIHLLGISLSYVF